MQANWSLLINVILLVGVIVAIRRMLKAKRSEGYDLKDTPSLGERDLIRDDDIISVRKVEQNISIQTLDESPMISTRERVETDKASSLKPSSHVVDENYNEKSRTSAHHSLSSNPSIMMFLSAKEHRMLAGYELLQTVLAAGLRFGDGHLFHRHQHPNGQGPVLCSLAAATATGVFDLQNIGAFSVRGLCLFMELSGNPTIDMERFEIMLETARQLSEGLDTHLLDEKQQPLSNKSIANYQQRIQHSLYEDAACL